LDRQKSSLNHFHIWGCPTEVWPYRPNEKKLNFRTVSCYFIGYSEKSRGFKFYDPKAKSFFETINARNLEDVDFVKGDTVRNIVFEEVNIIIPPNIIGIESIPTSTLLMTQLKTMLMEILPKNKLSILKKLCH
jgi:hypothetical protein